MHTLQTLVFPNLEVHAPEEMYLRLNDRSRSDLATPRLHFDAGGTASSDTFFNGLTVGTWKRHCDIRTLVLCLEGSGEARYGRDASYGPGPLANGNCAAL